MRIKALLLAALAICCMHTRLLAIEGSSTAGPIGGTDIRQAQLPPPGLYYGTIQVYATADHYFDGAAQSQPLTHWNSSAFAWGRSCYTSPM